uniref:L27 domain-containing protein n=1 Tax=Knipowitschia caucasica TaxID=637954 RepID=A0AAV2JDQ7_KNICA
MPVRKKDALRALGLLEEYCTKLTKPEEEQLKTAIQRVMGIFNSNLFEALLDIQEFYEVTLLNTQKSREQKLEEVNHMAEHWVRSTSAHDSEPTPAACLLEKEQSGSEPSGMERPVSSAKTAEQYQYQDDDSPPLDQGFPRLTNEVRAPELVHVSEKNLSEIENVHGYVSHSHISPLKTRPTKKVQESGTAS